MKTIKPLNLEIIETDLDCLSTNEGILIVLITPEGVMDPAARRVNKLTRGSLTRLISSCLLYTSPSPRDGLLSRMPSSA